MPRPIALVFAASLALACSSDGGDPAADGGSSGESGATTNSSSTTAATSTSATTSTTAATTTTTTTTDGTGGSTGGDDGPMVDLTDPQLWEFTFTPDEADPAAMQRLATQQAFLDTRVEPRGLLVVYMHGAGTPGTCGSTQHGQMLAAAGFHVFHPCYVSNYGVGNCGNDIGGCRLEAFEGVDHSNVIDIPRPDSTEERVVRGLEFLATQHPGGDWTYYLEGDQPRWDKIIISGSSHGASSSGVVGMNRVVDRVVMLSGPLDSGQAWLLGTPMTPIDRFYGFTHTGDGQHPGHLDAFEDMSLPGAPAVVDGAQAPYGDSHRLVSSAPTNNGHGSTAAGGSSPGSPGNWDFQPVWDTMYGVQ